MRADVHAHCMANWRILLSQANTGRAAPTKTATLTICDAQLQLCTVGRTVCTFG